MIKDFININSLLEHTESSLDRFVDNKNYNIDYYEDAMSFISNENTSITDSQINMYREMANGNPIDESTTLCDTGRLHLNRVIEWIRTKNKQVKARINNECTVVEWIKNKDKMVTFKDNKYSLKESVEDSNKFFIFSDIEKSLPRSINLNESVKSLREAYKDSLIIDNKDNNISDIYTLESHTDNIIRNLDKLIYNESSTVYDQTPMKSFNDLKNFIESVVIYYSTVCEAVVENYRVVTENKYTNNNYKYEYSTAIDLADDIIPDKMLISKIDSSIVGLEKELNKMTKFYNEWKDMSDDEKDKILRTDFIKNFAISGVKGITTGLLVGTPFIDLKSKKSISEAEETITHNINETKRAIKYLKKKKKEIETAELKGGN